MSKVINSFPGYTFIPCGDDGKPHNMYKGEDVGFGGYVWALPGMYGRTKCYDVSGMHPASIRALNCFGEYTKNFGDIVDARIAIKHKDFDKARSMLSGKLAPYLNDESTAKELAKALKIAVNSVYGLTAANFDNPFRDTRNKNNQVALRGALFISDLKREIQSRGFTVIHCKTDSIKVVEPSDEIEKFILDYGIKYGYQFEIEHIFEKICLVNDAVYVAKLAEDDPDDPGKWTATGTQFQVPYVFKTLFSKEPIEFNDMCETKSVTSALYLDMNEGLPEDEHSYQFIGKVGQFCPIKPGCGGGLLMREKDGKYSAATGTKGYRWMESEMVKELHKEGDIDKSYYTKLVDDAVDAISKFGDFEWFASDDILSPNETHKAINDLPWKVACGKDTCEGCPDFVDNPKGYICKSGYDIGDMLVVKKQDVAMPCKSKVYKTCLECPRFDQNETCCLGYDISNFVQENINNKNN